MIFSTYTFIFIFFPLVWIIYWGLNHFKLYSLAQLSLVIASFVFYGIGSPGFFPYFAMSVFGNYIVGSTLASTNTESIKNQQRLQRKIILTLGVLGNIGLLGYYKYTDFFISNMNFLFSTNIPLQRIILPIGISFFTFQLIAFLVDSYKGTARNYSVLEYLLFITFFPQLIVGPIIHHSEIIPQFNEQKNLKLNSTNIALGIMMFSVGCAKKILLADTLTEDAQLFFNNLSVVPNFLSAWFYSIEYTISYYFDLSGYADMAIGLGLLFNVEIPQNFDSPYKARNFQDYWQRWHITLSRFLGDYIFKNIFIKGNNFRNYYVATMITFLVSGFWHGAGWTFVVWGFFNGIFVCTASCMKRHNKKFPFFLSYSLTLIGIVVLRVLFVSETFEKAFLVFKGMINIQSLSIHTFASQFITLGKGSAKYLLLATLVCIFAPNSKSILQTTKTFLSDKSTKTKRIYTSAIFCSVLFVLSLANMNRIVEFLYFQF